MKHLKHCGSTDLDGSDDKPSSVCAGMAAWTNVMVAPLQVNSTLGVKNGFLSFLCQGHILLWEWPDADVKPMPLVHQRPSPWWFP